MRKITTHDIAEFSYFREDMASRQRLLKEIIIDSSGYFTDKLKSKALAASEYLTKLQHDIYASRDLQEGQEFESTEILDAFFAAVQRYDDNCGLMTLYSGVWL